MYVATSAQMKKYDQRLIKEGYSIEMLVDKASDCLVPHCISYDNITLICGKGNNGADGLSLAIKLYDLNKQIEIYLICDDSSSSKAYDYYFKIAKEKDIMISKIRKDSLNTLQKSLDDTNLIVDAIFGFGLHSNPQGITEAIIKCINKTKKPDVLSVDIPTGLNCNTGIPYENVILADKTITLTAYKQGFLNPESKIYTGEIILEKLKTKDFRKEQGFPKLLPQKWIQNQLKKRGYYGHKGTYGQILHITGSNNYKGAALLSAKASVYSGSGIVTVLSTQKTLSALTSYVPESVSILRDKTLTKNTISNYDAILIGPGIGLSEDSHAYVKELLSNAKIPLVIDADALTILAENKNLIKNYQEPLILTPHLGEFKRLVPDMNEDDIIDIARKFAEEYKVILILKGPNSLITNGKSMYKNISGNPTMSTAGAGDALAGIISSLLGQGYEPFIAALLGTYIHGRCADNLSTENYTSVTSKIIEEIPKVMNQIENSKSFL